MGCSARVGRCWWPNTLEQVPPSRSERLAAGVWCEGLKVLVVQHLGAATHLTAEWICSGLQALHLAEGQCALCIDNANKRLLDSLGLSCPCMCFFFVFCLPSYWLWCMGVKVLAVQRLRAASHLAGGLTGLLWPASFAMGSRSAC